MWYLSRSPTEDILGQLGQMLCPSNVGDIAAIPGSSGSPMIAIARSAGDRYLLGVAYAAPTRDLVVLPIGIAPEQDDDDNQCCLDKDVTPLGKGNPHRRSRSPPLEKETDIHERKSNAPNVSSVAAQQQQQQQPKTTVPDTGTSGSRSRD